MKKKSKQRISATVVSVTAVIAVFVGFVGLNVLAYHHASSMTHFATSEERTGSLETLRFLQKAKTLFGGVNLPRPTGTRHPSEVADGTKVLKIRSSEDVTLEAWYCDRGETTPLVILFHGYAAEKTSLLAEAHVLLGLGASVLLVDFRGSGGSSESYTTLGVLESDDVAAVVRFTEEQLRHTATILFGKSMGAVALLRAMQDPDIQPDAVIVEAVFDTMLNTVRNRFRAIRVPAFPSAELLVFWGGRQWGFDGFSHNPVDYAASVRCAILVMHGEDDTRARIEEGRRVFDAVSDDNQKQFLSFAGTGHESYVAKHPEAWQTAVAGVIRIATN